MVESPSAPSAPPSSSKGEPRYLVLLAITIVGTAIGALLVAVAFGALLSFLPSIVGVLLGLVLGLALPLFLALRASAGLRRKHRGLLVRRLAVVLLIGATQLALFGAVLNWSSRSTGNLAWTAHETLDVVGGVPVVSDLLYAHAERNAGIPGTELEKRQKALANVGPDGGVLDVGDGGALGLPDVDGGPAIASPSATDAGVASTPITTTPSARGPQPPKAKPGIPLSPRVAGKAARTFAASVTTSDGGAVLFVGTVAAGGAVTSRIVDLAAHEKLGDPTLVESADDGTVAAILGGSHLVISRPGKTSAEVVKALAPGQKLPGAAAGVSEEIQAVRDVVIGAGGAGLAIVSVLAAEGELAERLVTLPKGPAAPTILRRAGDKIPGAASDLTVAKSWAFKKGAGAGSVLVVESYLEGGDDLGTRLSGEQYTVNPQRLLVVKLDTPKALVELARTGLEPSGIAGLELQIFGDAALLPDGRAVFDANFIDKGGDGWLFVSKPAGGVFALEPDKRDSDGAPWTRAAPRARSLEASADGSLVFRRADGAAILTSVDRPGESVAALLNADALASDGKKLGSVASVDVPSLARGEWIIASVQMRAANGTTHDAIVLASRADVANGKAEVLLEVGATLPVPASVTPAPTKAGAGAPAPRKIQAIRYGRGRDELLW